jgi:hypothetical protein
MGKAFFVSSDFPLRLPHTGKITFTVRMSYAYGKLLYTEPV